eukprot:6192793-Pleurochrysis_carterae.AAC.1
MLVCFRLPAPARTQLRQNSLSYSRLCTLFHLCTGAACPLATDLLAKPALPLPDLIAGMSRSGRQQADVLRRSKFTDRLVRPYCRAMLVCRSPLRACSV